jgi:hypothetical protein
VFSGCKQDSKSNQVSNTKFSNDNTETVFKKRTFGYDQKFLQENYKNTIILESDDKKSKLITVP